MSVDSYLELFTTLFGWAFYGVLWDVLVGTGIVYLPFLGILIDNWREPAEGGEFGTVTGLSLRRMEIELFIALLVVVLAGQPAALTPLNAGTLSYAPQPTLTDPTPATATVAAPQSTYGAAGFTGSPATVNIPVWWYAVLAMSSGFNHAVVEGLPAASDLRTYEQQARLATIADPRLRQEASDFFSECYVPARSKYQAERPATAAVAGILATYGDDDPDWMGSHVYRDTAGYYDTLRPSKQIPGLGLQPGPRYRVRPGLAADLGQAHLQGVVGRRRPGSAREADQRGGRDLGRILRAGRRRGADPGERTAGRCRGPHRAQQRAAVLVEQRAGRRQHGQHRLARHGREHRQGRTRHRRSDHRLGALLGDDDRGAAGAAMVQALMLLGIYALLPMIVVLSRYSLSMMVVGAMAIFTIKFWSVLWYLAMWVDQNLILSMYPDVNVFLQIFANPGEHDAKRMLLNMITTSLYLGLPLLWSGMMAWAGVNVGRSIDNATAPLARPADDAGRQGGAIGKAAVSKGLRR